MKALAVFGLSMLLGYVLILLLLMTLPKPTFKTGIGEVYFQDADGMSIALRDEDVSPSGTFIIDGDNNKIYVVCYRRLVIFENIRLLEDGTDPDIRTNYLINICGGTVPSTRWSDIFPITSSE
jgi:hypothetical protein